MFRSTLDRKRKSTTGLLVIVVVGLLFYFQCSIHDSRAKVLPDRRIISTGYRLRDASSSTTTAAAPLLKRSEGQVEAMIQKNGYLPFNSSELVDPLTWHDLHKTQDKVSNARARESRLNRTRTKRTELWLWTGNLSKNYTQMRSGRTESRSGKSESRTIIMTSDKSRAESMSAGVNIRSNSAPMESDAFKFRSNISTLNSDNAKGLDNGRPNRRSDSWSRSSTVRFQFLLDVPGACERRPLVLVIVCSAWENAPRREVIRATWASLEDHQLRVLFIVGLPKQDNRTAVHQRALEEESSTHGDLLQADFIDSYANLSLKSIAMLQWAETSCQATRFLVKADDDVLVNTPLLLRDLALTRHHRFVMGNVIAGARPSRDRSSKWFTSTTVYPRDFYPKYISGAAYVISGDLVRDLYAAAVRAEVFWIEDVFITGLLLAASGGGSDVINAQHIYNGKFDIQKEFRDACALKRHILRHLSDPTDMTELWSVITSPSACVTLT